MLRNVLRLSALAAIVVGLGVAAACATSGTAATAPLTGIIVLSKGLVGNLGCGTSPGQVYKYAAVVINADGVPVAAGVYDCFADGTFVNLNPSDAGSLSFTLQIFAYDQSAYTAHQADLQNDIALVNTPGTSGPVDLFPKVPATWTTTCVATQQSQVEVLAVCVPLTAEPILDASADGTLEGSTPVDASGTDTGLEAGDAGDAREETEASADAGLPEAGSEPSATDAPSG